MANFDSDRRSIIQIWERRRKVYNLSLILPTMFGYSTVGVISAAVGDQEKLSSLGWLLAMLSLILAANVCYSGVYAIEFILWKESGNAWWQRKGRKLVFIAGTLISMLFAMMGGR